MISTNMKKINVCILGEHPPANRGGVGIHILNLSNNLARQDEIGKVYVISSGSKNKDIHRGNVHIYFRKIPFKKRYTTFQRDLVKIKFTNKIIGDVDVLHLHGIFSPFNFLLSKKIPLVVTVHGYSSLETVANKRIKKDSLQFKFMRYVERKTAQRADAIIAVGKTIREWIIKELGADAEKVFYVPNGIPLSKIKNIPIIDKKGLFRKLNLNMPTNSKLVVYAKALSEVNGIRTLVKAIPIVIREHPNTYFLILGDGPLKNEMINLSEKERIKNNIIFYGKTTNENVMKILTVADVFCVPLQPLNPNTIFGVGDTLGIAHLEAMGIGVPTIGTKKTVKKGEFEKEMNNSIIVTPFNDYLAVAKAIIYLLDHPEEAREMGKRAREYVLKNYTWDIVAKKTMEVYRYAMENHKN